MPTKHYGYPLSHEQRKHLTTQRPKYVEEPRIQGPANHHEAAIFFDAIPISIFRKSPGKFLRMYGNSGLRLLNHSKVTGYVVSAKAMDSLYTEYLELGRLLGIVERAVDQSTELLFRKAKRTDLEETLLGILSIHAPIVTRRVLTAVELARKSSRVMANLAANPSRPDEFWN